MSAVAPTETLRHRFRAMGCGVEVLAARGSTGVEDSFLEVEREIHRLEALLSRFRPESELSRLNRAGRVEAGPELLEVVAIAVAARTVTDGRFDPTVHDAVAAAGYDRDFEAIGSTVPDARGAPCGGGVDVDLARGTIELERGVRLDLGGVAKGYAVDRACALLRNRGSFLVNAGGDLAVTGDLDDGPWPVAAETACGWITLGLRHGALATSGRDVRRWGPPEAPAHHIVDPADGRPARGDLLRVTTFAGTAAGAEIRAKDLFLRGSAAAGVEADRLEAPTILVTLDGRTLTAGGLV